MLRLRFDRFYFIRALVLFIVLVLIALFVRDRFIRPIFGDFLVVIFIYYAVASVINMSKKWLAVGVLLFAYAVETGQYYNLVFHLGLKGNRLAEVVIGMGFTWTDMLAYTFGVIFVYVLDTKRSIAAT